MEDTEATEDLKASVSSVVSFVVAFCSDTNVPMKITTLHLVAAIAIAPASGATQDLCQRKKLGELSSHLAFDTPVRLP